MLCQVKFQILNGKYRVNVFERDPSLPIAWSFLFVCLITVPYLSRLLSTKCFDACGLQSLIFTGSGTLNRNVLVPIISLKRKRGAGFLQIRCSAECRTLCLPQLKLSEGRCKTGILHLSLNH